ncbi:hypothetical protein [Domibacillus aminovorans]|uniref:Uncharacterized protein n=1 Tax=Domibacillus aminovorans TaxID=29332 RepID=A0A177LC45_9BACI|nr:hypothetical protein [Domibacillus aminovorans]OAH63114.1 hypothetical protein AWH49_07175 [Domibacillus aminovorans]
MLEEKFDLETLENVRKKLAEIQAWSTIQRKAAHELYDMIDGLCRVAHMYNMAIAQQIEDGYITTSNPQSYIQSKLSTPYAIYRWENSKRESLK